MLLDSSSIVIKGLGPWISVFYLPKSDKKNKLWLAKIPRKFESTKIKKVVCIEYVCENFTVRCDEVKRDAGGVNCLERVRLYLRLSYLTINILPTF